VTGTVGGSLNVCRCRHDKSSELPIGIGMALADKVTADRLAENHRAPPAAPSRTALVSVVT
jgi:hypothetical protein